MTGPTRTLHWWDEMAEPPRHPGARGDALEMARDRLSLAATIQSASGGDEDIAALLGTWCLNLKRNPPNLATVIVVFHALDRLDRHACEPQTWQHLTAAEVAIAAYIEQARLR